MLGVFHLCCSTWQNASILPAAKSRLGFIAGSYFICDDEGTNVAVFKPEDEEPLAINNPKGGGSSADHFGSGLRRGIKPGEGAVREVAAFLLDHQHFSGVPPTAMVTCLQRRPSADLTGAVSLEEAKLGSLQQFVNSDGDCEERGSSVFAVKEVCISGHVRCINIVHFLEDQKQQAKMLDFSCPVTAHNFLTNFEAICMESLACTLLEGPDTSLSHLFLGGCRCTRLLSWTLG